jgi:hypothetical protein
MTRQILLVVVLLTAAPVCAQDQTGQQGGDGSGDGGRKSTDTRNVFTDSLGALLTGPSWNLGVSISGGYNRSNLPQVNSSSGTLTSIIRNGATGGISTQVATSVSSRFGSFGFGGGTSTNYFRSTGRFITSFSGSASQALQIGQRGRFSAGQSVMMAPYYALTGFQGLTNFSGTQLTMPLQPAVNQAIGDMRHYRYASTLDYSQQLTDRTSLSARYNVDASALITATPQLYYHMASAQVSHTLTQSFGFHAGYGYSLMHYTPLGRSDGFHAIDVGVDVNRGLSITRRAKICFSTGTTLNRRTPVSNSTTPGTGTAGTGGTTTAQPSQLVFNLVGNANLSYDIGRSWGARIQYGRTWQVVDGTYVPYLADAISGGVSGGFGRNVGIGAMGQYMLRLKQQSQTTSQNLSQGQAMAVNVFMNLRATDSISGFVNYGYYQQEFDLRQLGLNLPGALARQSVRGGVSFAFRSR